MGREKKDEKEDSCSV